MINLKDIISTDNKEYESMLNKIIAIGNEQILKTYQEIQNKNEKTIKDIINGTYSKMHDNILNFDDELTNDDLIPYLKKLDESVSIKIYRDVYDDIKDYIDEDIDEE